MMTRHAFRICGAALLLAAAYGGDRAQAQYVVHAEPVGSHGRSNATNVFAQAMVMPQNEIPRIAAGRCAGDRHRAEHGARRVRGRRAAWPRRARDSRCAIGAWQAPRFIQITGGSVGYQIGVQATDLVLVFRTPQSVHNLLRGTMKVGVDASAAAGPVGRQTSAGTDLQLRAEILSYSRARGAFVGVSIDGSSISLDPAAEAMYYQPPGAFPASACQLAAKGQRLHRDAAICSARARTGHRTSSRRCYERLGCRRAARRRCRSRAATTGQGVAAAVRQPRRQLETLSGPAAGGLCTRTRCPIRRRCSRRCPATKKWPAVPNTRR